MDDLLLSRSWWRMVLSTPDGWWQIAVLVIGAGATWLLGQYLRGRLETITRPGGVVGVGRTAVRTTALALIPALFWAWVAIAAAIFRKQGFATDLLRPAMFLIGAAAIIRAGVFVLRHSFSPGSRLKAWEGALSVTIWTIVALHILGWLPLVEQMLDEYALSFGRLRISIYNVVTFALVTALLLLVALWISNAIRGRVAKSAVLDESMKFALGKLSTFLLLALAVITSMVVAGIDLTAFAVFGGALGVGIGLGLQRIVSNFVSGFILAFEGSIRLGDWITVDGVRGRVSALHARHIVVRTEDGLDLLVPNENLLTSQITSWSYEGDYKVRILAPVQIGYGDDPEAALELLLAVAREHPKVLQHPAPAAMLTSFGDSGIQLELRCWIEDLEYGASCVRSEINRGIWQKFRAAGISIPFPQREVRLVGSDPTRIPPKTR
jgi:small-conductance mechanosensitive channel